MQESKKIKWWIVILALLVLLVMGYYSYKSDVFARNHGVYTISQVTDIRAARNGWKLSLQYNFLNKEYKLSGIKYSEDFSAEDVGERYLVKILPERPGSGVIIIPKIEIPDSIVSAPAKGWSEDWMKEHFPAVVEYVHDTR